MGATRVLEGWSCEKEWQLCADNSVEGGLVERINVVAWIRPDICIVNAHGLERQIRADEGAQRTQALARAVDLALHGRP